VVESLFPATFFVLACLVIHEISTGRATPGDFVFLMQYWENLTWPISMLSHNCRFLMSDLVDAERLLHLLQIQPSIKDHENAVNISVEGRIEFDNVNFAYESKQTTIHNLSLAVSPGQTMALVGETGAGKSSIMKLLLRLYDINEGRIMIDGHDIRDITLDSLRTAIGVVPQAPLLFNGTILENLRYARLDATDADIEEACRAAAIHDKILSFADGYSTKVGEQGVKLSGGEIQRLAIARVFLKDPPILILDEATSAVDSLTEAAVQIALDRLRKGRTTLVIAHRLSTIVKADQILVIHDGSILEQGTHEELLLKGGRYHKMWTSQTSAGVD
jgi:ABC-type multidrug transport system fused ATPase/permease subunit